MIHASIEQTDDWDSTMCKSKDASFFLQTELRIYQI